MRYLSQGIADLKKTSRFTPDALYLLIHDLLKAYLTAKEISRIIVRNSVHGKIFLYSYWLNSSALGSLLVRPDNGNIVRLSRAHRADLYQEQSFAKVLTFRTVLAAGLDCIFPVSMDGVLALRSEVGTPLSSKIQLSRLGTKRPHQLPVKVNMNEFLIVSCSFMAPVKRIHLIIETLRRIEFPFRWIHFGDGPMRASLEKLANEQLSGKKYEFRGLVVNREIMSFYNSEYVDIFLNTSSSEGIPVSIMEAQSFGIPCVAMNVGGMREIIDPASGLLLDPESQPGAIAEVVSRVLMLHDEERDRLRRNTIEQWSESYDAARNFPEFIKKIQLL